MVNLLEAAFPGLAKGDYRISSPRNADYELEIGTFPQMDKAFGPIDNVPLLGGKELP